MKLKHRIAMLLWSLAFYLAACEEHEPRPCERLAHHDSTGHVVLCDCTCSDEPAFACPATVVECTHPELADRWSDGSSSDAG